MDEDIFRGHGIKISLKNKEDFLKVKETLTRIGVASKKDNTLWQSAHILHKQGQYAILHFKELFAMDNKVTTFSEEDKARRNTIVDLLEEWGLVDILEGQEQEFENMASLAQIKVISHKDKPNWNLIPKYSIGGKKS